MKFNLRGFWEDDIQQRMVNTMATSILCNGRKSVTRLYSSVVASVSTSVSLHVRQKYCGIFSMTRSYQLQLRLFSAIGHTHT